MINFPVADRRLANTVTWYLSQPEDFMMRIPFNLKKCIAFIGVDEDGGISYKGTGFFISVPSTRISGRMAVYFVTGRHVVADIGTRDFYVRINTKDGKAIPLKGGAKSQWWFHPNEMESSDVAVFCIAFTNEQLQAIDFSPLPIGMIVTEDMIREVGIGDGDEVFIVGLFSHHAGSEKNLPIIRSGNIAMMPDEKVPTEKFGDMEVYLIEARSIGGLSGSPVFVLKPYANLNGGIALLGLIHGHWDVKPSQLLDVDSKKAKKSDWVNVGIAMVSPAKKIQETINRKELVQLRDELDAAWIEKHSPTPD